MINERTPYEMTVVARAEGQAEAAVAGTVEAKRVGFNSAVVPAPNVYSYMSRMPTEAWGLDWLEHGTMSMRNRRPIYEGDVVTKWRPAARACRARRRLRRSSGPSHCSR
jgi:hypothetical protein